MRRADARRRAVIVAALIGMRATSGWAHAQAKRRRRARCRRSTTPEPPSRLLIPVPLEPAAAATAARRTTGAASRRPAGRAAARRRRRPPPVTTPPPPETPPPPVLQTSIEPGRSRERRPGSCSIARRRISRACSRRRSARRASSSSTARRRFVRHGEGRDERQELRLRRVLRRQGRDAGEPARQVAELGARTLTDPALTWPYKYFFLISSHCCRSTASCGRGSASGDGCRARSGSSTCVTKRSRSRAERLAARAEAARADPAGDRRRPTRVPDRPCRAPPRPASTTPTRRSIVLRQFGVGAVENAAVDRRRDRPRGPNCAWRSSAPAHHSKTRSRSAGSSAPRQRDGRTSPLPR